MRLVSDKEQFVYGKLIRVGEEFEVPDGEGELWLKLKIAKQVIPSAPRRGRYHRTDMRAEDE